MVCLLDGGQRSRCRGLKVVWGARVWCIWSQAGCVELTRLSMCDDVTQKQFCHCQVDEACFDVDARGKKSKGGIQEFSNILIV